MKSNLIQLSYDYFNIFNKGDIVSLAQILDSTPTLIDWTNTWDGFENVKNTFINLFKLKLHIDVKEIKLIEQRTYCLINIKTPDGIIKVLDIIDWTDDCKIKRLEAFKG